MKGYPLFLVAFVVMFLGCVEPSDSALLESFRYTNAENVPQISAHRGGKGLQNYPENCLESMAYLNSHMSAIFEVDIAETKDGVLVLMHDNSLDRTTTGTGLVNSKTWADLQGLYLKDDFGVVSAYRIPRLDDVLTWAKTNNVVLTLDIKRGVSIEKVVQAIAKNKAEDQSIIITYSIDQAKRVHNLAPNLMLSVSARNDRELNDLLKSGIPTTNMLAFTGTRLSQAVLYKRLEELNILSILGTLGNLDGRAAARGDHLYREWKDLGINIIATDRPFEVHAVLNKNIP
jgi:glycerophosphoryl diester phosphodiesterase